MNWVNNNMSWGLDVDNTNTTFIKTSLLGQYTLNYKIYKWEPPKTAFRSWVEGDGSVFGVAGFMVTPFLVFL
jgi:hypothetical protein